MVSGCQMVSEYIDTLEMTHMTMYFLDLPRTTQDADASSPAGWHIHFLGPGDPQPNYDLSPVI